MCAYHAGLEGSRGGALKDQELGNCSYKTQLTLALRYQLRTPQTTFPASTEIQLRSSCPARQVQTEQINPTTDAPQSYSNKLILFC